MVADVSFSPDARSLASVDIDGVVKLWDLRSERSVTNLFQFSGRGLSISFSQDGRYLAAGGWREARIWDRHRSEWMRVENLTTGRAIFSPVSPGRPFQRKFFWFGSGGKRPLWDYSGSRSNALRLPNSGGRIAFSADAGCWPRVGQPQIHLWDTATGKHVGQTGEARASGQLGPRPRWAMVGCCH
jgi:hypothetical protein